MCLRLIPGKRESPTDKPTYPSKLLFIVYLR